MDVFVHVDIVSFSDSDTHLYEPGVGLPAQSLSKPQPSQVETE